MAVEIKDKHFDVVISNVIPPNQILIISQSKEDILESGVNPRRVAIIKLSK